MGMAASQARLLMITARIHDVEYQAQSIQHAKLALATQSDEAYREYTQALDATTLTVNALDPNSGEKSLISATFNNLCSRNRVIPADGKNYAILNNEGRLVVEDDVEEKFYKFIEAGYDDPYMFAMYMMAGTGAMGQWGNLGSTDSAGIQYNTYTVEEKVYAQLASDPNNTRLISLRNKLEEVVHKYDPYDDIYYPNALISAATGSDSTARGDYAEYKELLSAYKQELYKLGGKDIYTDGDISDPATWEEYSPEKINYYVNLFNQIKACGGCVSISDYDGPSGDAANSSDWLQSMVQSGLFTIELVETDPSTGNVIFNTTSPSSDISLSYTTTSTIDSTALKKAEAEYEHKLKQIDKKDKAFDLDLSKLETERSALTTEYESVKKVVTDNIDRTFGIFS